MLKRNIKIATLLLFSCFSLMGIFGSVSAKALGEKERFYVDASYDVYSRDEVEAELVRETDSLYFYAEKDWWERIPQDSRDNVENVFQDLAKEFDETIYPVLSSKYGSEWSPGIDYDTKITILVHPLKEAATGYFNNGDEYSIYQNPRSNQREMIYLDARHITDGIVRSYLAHELTHLITFNQKEKNYNIQEEVWLNEARAEYAPTLCGYNDDYEGSYLKTRVNEFLNNPTDSITEWQGASKDYGALSIFIHYLVDHYGEDILIDSISSSKVGIESINEALENNGFENKLSDIFRDWAIAVFINDCSLGDKYCYLNKNLGDLRVVPQVNYLPMSSESVLSVFYQTKDWAGNWHKIFGGKGSLEFEFDGENSRKFEVPYITCRKEGDCSIGSLELADNQRGRIEIVDFSDKYSYFAVIPLIQEKKSDFGRFEESVSYSWKAKTSDGNGHQPPDTENLPPGESSKERLLKELLALLKEIKERMAEILAKRGQSSESYSCGSLEIDLYYGMRNNDEVACLQDFLKDQGNDIYPEALVTGNFLSLTQAAVIRFQEKYSSEILAPLGLEKGTGYVGKMTREKIKNQRDVIRN